MLINIKYIIILIFYIIILAIFKYINNSYYRFILLSILAFIILYILKINKKYIFIYLLLSFFAVFTEIIFIKYFYKTWFYHKNEFLNIPYWLFPLWLCCITFIIELYNIIK